MQVRGGLKAYIAGCMSGRGAMAGAGCGITCKCSMLRIQNTLYDWVSSCLWQYCRLLLTQLHNRHTVF